MHKVEWLLIGHLLTLFGDIAGVKGQIGKG